MGRRYSWNEPCCVCGRFTSYGADNAIRWGHSYETEPADPYYWCAACALKEIEKGLQETTPWDSYWQKPDWWLALQSLRRWAGMKYMQPARYGQWEITSDGPFEERTPA